MQEDISWENRIGGCFGVVDQRFARHPCDSGRAFELLAQLRKQGICWVEVRKEFKKYLTGKGVSPADRKTEMERVRRMYKPWLND